MVLPTRAHTRAGKAKSRSSTAGREDDTREPLLGSRAHYLRLDAVTGAVSIASYSSTPLLADNWGNVMTEPAEFHLAINVTDGGGLADACSELLVGGELDEDVFRQKPLS